MFGLLPTRFHSDRAVLEFGDFADRIERRIGQQIRRRLVETEGYKYRAARRAVIGARVKRNCAASRLDSDDLAGYYTEDRKSVV